MPCECVSTALRVPICCLAIAYLLPLLLFLNVFLAHLIVPLRTLIFFYFGGLQEWWELGLGKGKKYHLSFLVIQFFLSLSIFIFWFLWYFFWSLPRLILIGRLCFNLRQCFLCSSCTAGLICYPILLRKSTRLYQFSDV